MESGNTSKWDAAQALFEEALPVRLLNIVESERPRTRAMRAYVRQLSTLLDAELAMPPVHFELEETSRFVVSRAACAYDLIVLGDANPSRLVEAGLIPTFLQQSVRADSPSLLVCRRPAWPVRHILLVIRGEITDLAAVEWSIRFATCAGSRITVLVTLPPAAPRPVGAHCPLSEMLTTDTVPGQNLRKILRRLVETEVESVLKMKQGAVERQVRQELIDAHYDLVVVSAEPPGRLLGSHLGRLVESLLFWTIRPVFVARPMAPPTAPAPGSMEENVPCN